MPQHPFPPGRAEPRPQFGVAQQPAQTGGQRARVPRGHRQARLPVAPRDLGYGAAGRGEQGRARRHGLGGRQGEALVQRRHARDLRRAHQVDEFRVGDALDEVDGAGEVVPLHRLGDGPLRGPLADDDEVRAGLLSAHLGERLDQMDQALQRHVRAGRRDDPARHDRHRGIRREQVRVGADVDHVDPVLAHTEVVDDLLAGRAGDGEHGGEPAGDALLHAREGVPAAHRQAPLPAVRGVQLQLPVDGDGVVDRGHEGRAHVSQQPVPERLVVVDDVELAAAGPQMAAGAQREGQGLGEAAGPHGRHFERVDPVAVLVAPGRAERIRLAVEVEAGQLGEALAVVALVEDGVGLGTDDLDTVAEAGQFAREVPDVDALAAAERVPFIGEERDVERSQAVGGGVLRGPGLPGLSGHSGPLLPALSREITPGR